MVIGYHKKKRINRANRQFWYDLKTSIIRRGRYPILIPRLVYSKFCALWNSSKHIPGGAIIEFNPYPTPSPLLPSEGIDIRIYLAIFNSSIFEVMVRGNAQVYGGGTYTIGINQFKQTPVINVQRLGSRQINALTDAYDKFLSTNGDRSAIDSEVYKLLNWHSTIQQTVSNVLRDMVQIATSAKK